MVQAEHSAEPGKAEEGCSMGSRARTSSRWSFGVQNPKVITTQVPGKSTAPRTKSPAAINATNKSAPKTTRNGSIILDPQPSSSPNDPLNWPPWQRDLALASLSIYCMVGGGMTPLLAAGFTDIAASYAISVPQVALATGMFMLGLGVGCVLVSPTAILYGKRPVYLASTLVFAAASVWCALSPDFASLLAARILQGVAVSPVEALPSATIAEIFFLHERAFRIGVYALMLLGGKNLGPLASAAAIDRLGWRWVVVMVGGLCGVLLFLFVPETFWDRAETDEEKTAEVVGSDAVSRSSNSPTATPQDDSKTSTEMRAISQEESAAESRTGIQPDINNSGPVPVAAKGTNSSLCITNDIERQRATKDVNSITVPFSFVSHLTPWHGRLRASSKWHLVALRPLILLTYPSILYSAAVYACCMGWLVILSETMALVYRTPSTYNFSALSAGLVYLSPFIGGVLGTAVAGRASDIMVQAMARRNGGVFEPEFRLVMVAPVALTTAIGLMGFGWSAQAHDAWIVPTIFFGVVSFGCALGSTTAITFCVDSYPQFAGEALVTLNFSKNIFHGLVFSLFVTGWVEADSFKSVFIWIGIIQLILLVFTVPMYMYGKRARHWTAEKGLCQSILYSC
ncbi:major facilitator superfamily domain-containing protein [Podospora didyma]|uniref:Major facilitator superfamily domain-containing protein n=1 Tax=Podospora didyma TaxID=330526 RepID=A0AAE0K5Q7_9PEZI|nr:major facilitator superfamily domain-containing protein [Podospora didyma]